MLALRHAPPPAVAELNVPRVLNAQLAAKLVLARLLLRPIALIKGAHLRAHGVHAPSFSEWWCARSIDALEPGAIV